MDPTEIPPPPATIVVEKRSTIVTWLSIALLIIVVIMGYYGLKSLARIEDSLSTGTHMSNFISETIDKKITELGAIVSRGFLNLSKTENEGFNSLSESVKNSGNLVSTKIDSMIIGENASVQAAKENFEKINKSVGELKSTIDATGDKIITATTPAAPAVATPTPPSPPPLPTNPPEPRATTSPTPSMTQSSGLPDTKAVVRGGRNPVAKVYTVDVNTVSDKFPVEDVLEGKIRPSKTVGVMVRSYLRGWHNGWLDSPIEPDGTYYVSPQAYKVSYYSQTISFEIRRYE